MPVAVAAALVGLSACGGGPGAQTDPLVVARQEVDPAERVPVSLTEGWRFEPVEDWDETEVRVSPAVGSRHVYLGVSDALLALDVESGSPAWRAQLAAPLSAAPAVDGNRVVVATQTVASGPTAPSERRPALTWYEVETGRFAGSLPLEEPPVDLLAAGSILLAVDGSRALAVQMGGAGTSPVELWSVELAGARHVTVAPDAGTALVTAAGMVIAVDPASGRERWRYSAPDTDTQLTEVAVDRNNAYFAGTDGLLVSLDLDDGDVRWRRRVGLDIVGAPSIADELIWTAGFDANLYAFKDNGTTQYRLPIGTRNYVDLATYGPWVVVGPRRGPWIAVRRPNEQAGEIRPARVTLEQTTGIEVAPAAGPDGVALLDENGVLVFVRPQRLRGR